jgi:DNA-nicking Smr family endonuclease
MDDFGKILEQWENDDKSRYVDKDKILSRNNIKKTTVLHRTKDLKKMKPQDKLDLHGYTAAEAEIELERFLKNSKMRGLQKVLIVHGKGYHSEKGPVLIETVNTYLRRCSFTGMTGTPDQSLGGSGAVWVIIK